MPKILIVDDDEAASDSLVCSLIANDFAVDVARTGREGIAKATAGDYDAVALSMELRDANGLTMITTM